MDRGTASEAKYIVFRVSGRACALPLVEVREVLPAVPFHRPPGMSRILEGFFDLGGRAIPVLKLDRLLDLPEQKTGLYSHLLLVGARDKAVPSIGIELGLFALFVEGVSSIVNVEVSSVTPLRSEDSFNGCSVGAISIEGDSVHVLSLSRLLLEKEQRALEAFVEAAQKRLNDLQQDEQKGERQGAAL